MTTRRRNIKGVELDRQPTEVLVCTANRIQRMVNFKWISYIESFNFPVAFNEPHALESFVLNNLESEIHHGIGHTVEEKIDLPDMHRIVCLKTGKVFACYMRNKLCNYQ